MGAIYAVTAITQLSGCIFCRWLSDRSKGDPAAIDRALNKVTVVLNCAGPFKYTAEPLGGLPHPFLLVEEFDPLLS